MTAQRYGSCSRPVRWPLCTTTSWANSGSWSRCGRRTADGPTRSWTTPWRATSTAAIRGATAAGCTTRGAAGWCGLLPCSEFREVRLNRNRYKITADEQERLAAVHIGIVGLSVGNMAAVTLALEGIATTYTLADFDAAQPVEPRTACAVASRTSGWTRPCWPPGNCSRSTPWFDIRLQRDGIQPDDDRRDFLVGGGRLDLVVEDVMTSTRR